MHATTASSRSSCTTPHPPWWSGSTGCRTLPQQERSATASGWLRRRLLLLSCAAFEAMPEVLANGIANVPTDLAAQDPDDLLLEIFREARHGAGAVIDRLPLREPPCPAAWSRNRARA